MTPLAPSCRPQSAQSQLARALPVRSVTGPHARTPRIHSQWVVAPGRTPQGPVVGCGRAPTLDAPHTGKRRLPRAPSCRPHNAQSQLARARAVGLVTGPHARTPGTISQWVLGPGRTPQGRAVGRGRAPYPGCPTHRQEAPPPGALLLPPERAKCARKSARFGVSDGSQRPHPPQSQPVGSGPRLHAPSTGSRATGSAQFRTPHTQARGVPPGRPCAAPTARKASSQERALWGW